MKFSNKLLSVFMVLLLALSLCVGITACQSADSSTKEPVEATFTFKVVHSDGSEKTFEVTTNERTVGAALLKEGLISGEDGEFGLYVKVVNGETADYDVDQSYWSFYVGDEYSMTGADQTEVTDGGTYSFRYTK